jgi:hypothetical protein
MKFSEHYMLLPALLRRKINYCLIMGGKLATIMLIYMYFPASDAKLLAFIAR